MKMPTISQDDVTDVVELTNKIEDAIDEILEGQNKNIALSALIGACINSMLSQCTSSDQILFYRNVFIEIYDNTIDSR